MRDVIVIIVVLLLVFGGGNLSNLYIEKSAKKLMNQINEMTIGFEKTEDDKKAIVNKVIAEWENVEMGWIVFEYHESINDIEDLLIECYTYFLDDNESEYMVSFGRLKRHVDDMKNRGTLTYVNIF